MKSVKPFLSLCVVLVAGLACWHLLSPEPAIIRDLRSMPEVSRVDFFGPTKPTLTVVHIRDWHWIPKEFAVAEGLDHEAVLSQAEKVQEEQVRIVGRLNYRHDDIKAVYSEGLSTDSMPSLHLRLDLLRDINNLAVLRQRAGGDLDATEKAQQRELILTIGTPGRLLLRGDIEEVLPLEDEESLQAAKPVVEGKLAPDDTKIAARQKAMVKNLPASGLAVVVLGGNHDLGPYLPAGTLYARVTPKSFPD